MSDTIILPISRFLEVFFAYKDKIMLDKSDPIYTELIVYQNAHPDKCESLFHIQTHTEKLDVWSFDNTHMVAVWAPKDWSTAYTNHLRRKRESEEFALKWEMKKEVQDEICSKIGTSIGLPPTHAAVKGIAEKIFNTRNRTLAEVYGIRLPSDEELRVGKFEVKGSEV
jgi:hypothetical protein